MNRYRLCVLMGYEPHIAQHPEGEWLAFEEAAQIVGKQKLEIARLRDALDDAVALLRDWEDYDVGDRECMWPKRRDEFLAEHEEDGR